MDLDISSLWSWTLPLWGLVLIILFLGGIVTHPPVIMKIVAGEFDQKGGAKRVRFALP